MTPVPIKTLYIYVHTQTYTYVCIYSSYLPIIYLSWTFYEVDTQVYKYYKWIEPTINYLPKSNNRGNAVTLSTKEIGQKKEINMFGQGGGLPAFLLQILNSWGF